MVPHHFMPSRAYLVLTLATVVHFVLMMAAESHNIVMIYWTIFFMAGDLVSSLALLLGGEEDCGPIRSAHDRGTGDD